MDGWKNAFYSHVKMKVKWPLKWYYFELFPLLTASFRTKGAENRVSIELRFRLLFQHSKKQQIWFESLFMGYFCFHRIMHDSLIKIWYVFWILLVLLSRLLGIFSSINENCRWKRSEKTQGKPISIYFTTFIRKISKIWEKKEGTNEGLFYVILCFFVFFMFINSEKALSKIFFSCFDLFSYIKC